jgi:hypothetical protein
LPANAAPLPTDITAMSSEVSVTVHDSRMHRARGL